MDAISPRLSDALRERTAALHLQAERTGVVNDILRRKADRRGYALLLRNLLPAYAALESALSRHAGDPALGVFAHPALQRRERMTSDLAALCGASWDSALELLPAGERYAARVAEAGRGDGLALLAHAYVRYFGDLSGGQILKRLLGEALRLPPESLSFYDFPGIADPSACKDEMRDAIDTIPAAGERSERIIAEGVRAFELNIAVSDEVQARTAAAG